MRSLGVLRRARAGLVAWRTTHHRLGRVVGETNGVPTYSIGGVQVVFLPGSHHLRRVVNCTHCGAPVIDSSTPVYHRRDLDAESHVMCDVCASIPVHPPSTDKRPPDTRPASAS